MIESSHHEPNSTPATGTPSEHEKKAQDAPSASAQSAWSVGSAIRTHAYLTIGLAAGVGLAALALAVGTVLLARRRRSFLDVVLDRF
jgi:hypothetical protein